MNLEVRNLSVSFGDVKVLDNVSHDFRAGKITMLMGPNGCGKTTIIRALVNLYAGSGELSYIPQDISGETGLTVRDMVALGRYDKSRFFQGETEEDSRHIEDALLLMELNDKQGQLFDTLSGGEKQRCMAARAICQDASWFIMDEPASNLDPVHSKHILDTARELVKNAGKSFIIVMHDVNLAASYGDEFVLMKNGTIGNTASKLTAELLSQTFDTVFESVTTPSGKNVFYAE